MRCLMCPGYTCRFKKTLLVTKVQENTQPKSSEHAAKNAKQNNLQFAEENTNDQNNERTQKSSDVSKSSIDNIEKTQQASTYITNENKNLSNVHENSLSKSIPDGARNHGNESTLNTIEEDVDLREKSVDLSLKYDTDSTKLKSLYKKKKQRPISEYIQSGPEDSNINKKMPMKRKSIINVEDANSSQAINDIVYQKFPKDEASKKLIKEALKKNDFTNNLMDSEKKLDTVVEAMSPQHYEANNFIIKEGDSGSHLYVSAEGEFEVLKGGKMVKKFGPGEAFGELAILYKSKRFASIKATTKAKVWSLERSVFQKITIVSGKQEQEKNVKFLSTVPDFEGINPEKLSAVSDFLKREFYPAGSMIVRQGERGDKFYIIRGGTVVITKRPPDGGPEQFVKEISRGAYFGEQALLHDDRRLATVTAKAPGVELLVLDKAPFIEYLGGIAKLKEPPTDGHISKTTLRKRNVSIVSEFSHIQLKELKVIGTLGVGGFGRVDLVQYTKDTSKSFALKKLKKVEVVQRQQQQYAYNEKSIMAQCDSPFICKLYKTYKDNQYIYFLMEVLLGGDIWSALQIKRCFKEKSSRFMVACVVEAFEYLHSRDIIYRDLKPENLMFDSKGYVKLVDFGYAKHLPNGSKTYTFAGTPEYVAPEVILCKGHDRAVDYWTLGVFTHELLVGRPPFRGTNHMKTYNMILEGIDAFEFNQKITKNVKHFIKRLCKAVPMERLGYLKNGIADIKNHKWFADFEWEKLRDRTLDAPLIRPISSNTDLSNFEKYAEDRRSPPEEISGWDADF